MYTSYSEGCLLVGTYPAAGPSTMRPGSKRGRRAHIILHRQYCGPGLEHLGNPWRVTQTLIAAGQWAVSHSGIVVRNALTQFPKTPPHLVPIFSHVFQGCFRDRSGQARSPHAENHCRLEVDLGLGLVHTPPCPFDIGLCVSGANQTSVGERRMAVRETFLAPLPRLGRCFRT
jgi:hypothetical protein